MRLLIAGGTGLIGTALAKSLLEDGHSVLLLARGWHPSHLLDGATSGRWDGRTTSGWGELVNQIDAVVNLAGENLSHWPWTKAQKGRFWDSRVNAGQALIEAIRMASPRPKVLIQISGINHYGLRGDPADETTPPGDDFLARLTVAWEDATQEVESLGVRRAVVRQAVVLARDGGLLPLMALPVRLFVGGPIGGGRQAVPWVHVEDVVSALRFLLENESARGPYNLVAPQPTSNAAFYRALAGALKRPYWFPAPAFLLRWVLGGLSDLVVEGRYSSPRRLLESGFKFKYENVEDALNDIYAA